MTTKNKHKEELMAAGRALYGDRWKAELARALGISDGRRIRQWLSDDRPIPEGVWTDTANLLRQKQREVDEALSQLLQNTPAE